MTRNRQQPCDFFGQYETRLLEDGRIRLPAAVVDQLQDGGVEEVRLGVIPGLPALALCPGPHWKTWLRDLRTHFPVLSTPEGLRAFATACSVCALDDQGRIYVPARLRKHLGTGQEGHDVVVVGVIDYFEIWAIHVFDDMIRRCQETLMKPALRDSQQLEQGALQRGTGISHPPEDTVQERSVTGLLPFQTDSLQDAPIPSIRNHASPYAKEPSLCNDEHVGKRRLPPQAARRDRKPGKQR